MDCELSEMVNPPVFPSSWQMFVSFPLQECGSQCCRWRPHCATYCPASRWRHANTHLCVLLLTQNLSYSKCMGIFDCASTGFSSEITYIYIYIYVCVCVCVCIDALVAQWLRCCATNQKVAGSIPDVVIGICHWHKPSDRTMALGSTQTLTALRLFIVGKGGRYVRLTTLPASCNVVI
jgi:hypothetical protein